MTTRNAALLVAGLALLKGTEAITPQQMLSANQYGSAFPNPSGVSANGTRLSLYING